MGKNQKPWEKDWKVGDTLGAGGQGTARLVTNRGSDRVAVLKELTRKHDPERRGRMRREVVALETLDHPSIPGVVEHNTDKFDDQEVELYLIMDFMEGTRLDKAVQAPWEPQQAITFVLRLLEVLEYCHDRDTVHRDLKPDNILVADNGTPLLVDFGLSFNVEQHADNLTLSGQQIGNRFLGLPELRAAGKGGQRDPRSDLTSCCGILFFLLTGKVPAVLEDEQGRKPHEREPGARILGKRLAGETQARLNWVFSVGFNQRLDSRWPSIEALRRALRPPQSETEEINAEFDRLAMELREPPSVKQYARAREVLEDARKHLHTVYKRVSESLSDVLKFSIKEKFPENARNGSTTIMASRSGPPELSASITFHLGVSDSQLFTLSGVANARPKLKNQPKKNLFSVLVASYEIEAAPMIETAALRCAQEFIRTVFL